MNNIPVEIKLGGKFDIVVKHGDGTQTEYPDIANLITNQGRDMYGGIVPSGYSNGVGGITVGTGNATPANTDLVLQAPIGYSQNQTGSSDSAPSLVPPYAQQASGTFTFAVGAVVGNIAEIGLTIANSTGAATNRVFSRALIMVGGSPGTITLVAADQLVVTYTLTMTIANDVSGSMTVTTNGVPASINYTARPAVLGASTGGGNLGSYVNKIAATGWNMYSSTGTAFVATNNRPGSSHNATFLTSPAYVAGSFTQNYTFNWPTGSPFTSLLYCPNVAGMMNFQILFASTFGPTTTQTMQFTITYSWL